MLLSARHLLSLLAAVGAATVPAACAGGDGGGTDEPSRETAGEPPAGSPQAAAGEFPDEPQALFEFADRPASWPERVVGEGTGRYVPGGYELVARPGGAVYALAPRPARPPERGVLLEAALRLPPPPHSAGLFCRADDRLDTGYELLVDDTGRWRLDRVEEARREALGQGRVNVSTTDPRGRAPLRLVCGTGTGTQPVTVAFTVGVNEIDAVRDPQPLLPEGAGQLGLLTRAGDGPAAARFSGLAVSYAE